MKKMKKVLATLMAMTMLSSMPVVSGCDFGSREMTSIVVIGGSYDATYTLNESVTFEGMGITAKFNDASEEAVALQDVKFYLNGEDITSNLNKITESVGVKSIVVEYNGKKVTITVTVSSDTSGGEQETTKPVKVAGFERPASYVSHLSQKNAAGKAAYGTEGYEAQFAKGDDMYVAGDDNAFKFLPTLRFLNANNDPETALSFASKTDVSMKVGDEYVALEVRAADGENLVEYFSGEDVYLTANTSNNTYDFTETAIEQQFKLSVKPAGNFQYTGSAVECEVSVVDGFNVYTAKQLSVVDNGIDAERGNPWADIKQAEGLTNVNPSAVILHNDILMTAEDIPASLTYTLDKEITYYREGDAATKANPVKGSSTFIYDGKDVFNRVMGAGESFKLYGNYFSIDLSQMPLVASFANEYTRDYEADGSNTQLFRVNGEGKIDVEPTSNFSVENINVKGNANISDLVYVDADNNQKSVYAGGLIFYKSMGTNTTFDNMLARTNFITYISEDANNTLTVKNTKAYDSYSNTAYLWGKSKVNFENCNFERTGGPLMLSVHKDIATATDDFPTVTADDDCIFKNLVTGQEFWFTSYGATELVANLRAMNALFTGTTAYLTDGAITNSFINADDKLNIICAVITSESSASAVTTAGVQGHLSYKGFEIDRRVTSPIGQAVHGVFAQAAAMGSIGVSFNIKNTVVYYDGATSLLPVSGNMEDLAGLVATEESYLTVNLGAFSIFLEYFKL